MLLASMLSVMLLIVTVTHSLRVCNDCISVYQCPQAIYLARNNKSQMTVDKIINATCSIEKERKVCCSDFLTNQPVETENVDDEIENHPNVQLLPNECGKIAASRLLGGPFASQYDFPWLVLIANRVSRYLKFDCEGTLINSKYVLTTAHCIKNKQVAGVRVGDYDIRTRIDCFGYGPSRKCEAIYQDIGVEETITHENYSIRPVPTNDIALLRLQSSVDISVNTVGAVCLPVYRNHLNTYLYDKVGIVAGWSIVGDEITPSTIQRTTALILNPETCQFNDNSYQEFNEKKQVDQILYATGELGDNMRIEGEGAPLMVEGEYNDTYKYIQYGIQGHGHKVCGNNITIPYIDIRKFMKWILDSIKP